MRSEQLRPRTAAFGARQFPINPEIPYNVHKLSLSPKLYLWGSAGTLALNKAGSSRRCFIYCFILVLSYSTADARTPLL